MTTVTAGLARTNKQADKYRHPLPSASQRKELSFSYLTRAVHIGIPERSHCPHLYSAVEYAKTNVKVISRPGLRKPDVANTQSNTVRSWGLYEGCHPILKSAGVLLYLVWVIVRDVSADRNAFIKVK